MAVRKMASAMTASEINRFIHAFGQLVNASGDPNPLGQLVSLHRNPSYTAHSPRRLLPWHRVYLLKIERMMQAIDDRCFIPYWRWTTQRAVPPWVTSFGPTIKVPGPNITVSRKAGAASTLPTMAQIRPPNGVLAAATFDSFAAQLGALHRDVLEWVGGTMADRETAPADPLFWLHQAQIDRLWSLWQASHPDENPSLSGSDAILHPWTDLEQDVRSIEALGYSYQAGLP